MIGSYIFTCEHKILFGQCESSDFLCFPIQVYITKVDPTSSLGLSTDSVYSYSMGHIKRVLGGDAPETQPSRCMSRGPTSITVALKGLNRSSSTFKLCNKKIKINLKKKLICRKNIGSKNLSSLKATMEF